MSRKRLTTVFNILVWLTCGYTGGAIIAGDFYTEFGPSGIETKGSVARKAILFSIAGPACLLVSFTLSNYMQPMWNWPIYILEFRESKK